MIVNIYDYDAAGNETFSGMCELSDALSREDDPEAYDAARDELRQSGRVWIGGGAAPLVLLKRYPEDDR